MAVSTSAEFVAKIKAKDEMSDPAGKAEASAKSLSMRAWINGFRVRCASQRTERSRKIPW